MSYCLALLCVNVCIATAPGTLLGATAIFPQGQPVYKKLSLEMLGIDSATFLSDIRPAYEQLQWDQYDVARGGLNKSSRKRGIAEFQLHQTGPTWSVNRVQAQSYVQTSNHGAYDRTTPRTYPEVDVKFTSTTSMTQLLRGLVPVVREASLLEISQLRIILTFLRTVVDEREGRGGVCALEGAPHVDGMDYIVSALAIARENLEADTGKSFVHSADGATLLETVLQPGEGIFQDDKNLLHHISNIKQDDKSHPGIRDILGIDIEVVD